MRNVDDIHRKADQPQHSGIFELHKGQRAVEHSHQAYIISASDDLSAGQPLIRAQQKVQRQQPAAGQLQPARRYKMYAAVIFTIFVLGFGAFVGGRLVSFANGLSASGQSASRTLTEGIGAVLGPIIPGLKNLDNSAVANAIANGKRINILLLGYGGEGHDGSYLTDTMMLLSVDFSKNTATYISVPRDTWVKIPTSGYDGSYAKINAAFALGLDAKNYPYKLPQFTGANGAGNMSKYEVSQVLGVPVDYYASIDFYAFQKIVDILGGVQVNVENSFTDYSYPSGDQNTAADYCTAEDIPDDLISNCRFKKVHFDAGWQYMDGERALEYARSRHAAGVEGTDYARSARQQKLLSAIEQKALNLGVLPKIFTLMDNIQGHFKSDLSLAEIKDLADYLRSGKLAEAQRISLTDQGEKLLVASWSADRQWILIPAAGPDDFSAIHNYIRAKLLGR